MEKRVLHITKESWRDASWLVPEPAVPRGSWQHLAWSTDRHRRHWRFPGRHDDHSRPAGRANGCEAMRARFCCLMSQAVIEPV